MTILSRVELSGPIPYENLCEKLEISKHVDENSEVVLEKCEKVTVILVKGRETQSSGSFLKNILTKQGKLKAVLVECLKTSLAGSSEATEKLFSSVITNKQAIDVAKMKALLDRLPEAVGTSTKALRDSAFKAGYMQGGKDWNPPGTKIILTQQKELSLCKHTNDTQCDQLNPISNREETLTRLVFRAVTYVTYFSIPDFRCQGSKLKDDSPIFPPGLTPAYKSEFQEAYTNGYRLGGVGMPVDPLEKDRLGQCKSLMRNKVIAFLNLATTYNLNRGVNQGEQNLTKEDSSESANEGKPQQRSSGNIYTDFLSPHDIERVRQEVYRRLGIECG